MCYKWKVLVCTQMVETSVFIAQVDQEWPICKGNSMISRGIWDKHRECTSFEISQASNCPKYPAPKYYTAMKTGVFVRFGWNSTGFGHS